MSTKLLIIGGVAGGATAAARARRIDEQAEIIIFERGEYISFANCGLPYYIGEVIQERDQLLVTTPEAFYERYNIDIRVFTEVTAIDRANKRVEVKNLITEETYSETYDKLILSPGAEPVPAAHRGDRSGQVLQSARHEGFGSDQGLCRRHETGIGRGGGRRLHRSRDGGKSDPARSKKPLSWKCWIRSCLPWITKWPLSCTNISNQAE